MQEMNSTGHAGHLSVLIGGFAILTACYAVGKIIYALCYDPLSKIPGRKLDAISRLPYCGHILSGNTVENVINLHKKYGDVVRFSPNEVSFISIETAFPDIYGFRTGKLKGHVNMQKDPVWYAPPTNGAPSILVADDEGHSKARRLLSHAFSAHALAGQESLVQGYVDQLIDRLKETSASGKQDVTNWYNWLTFDVMADLLFGEPFGCLQNLSTHKYIRLIFESTKAASFFYIIRYFPIVSFLGSLIVSKDSMAKRIEFHKWVQTKTKARVERDTERPDFITHILAHQGEKGLVLSDEELVSNAHLMLIAGSETTATLLSGVTYCLLNNPDKLQKLYEEVRGRWKSYEDITLAEVNNAPYLLAVLAEALRFFPPVPFGFQRKVGPGGEFVSDYYLPEGTGVSVSHYPAYHSESNFKNADSYIPERWLDDPEYENDKRASCQPFSFGPRSCLGKNLAYAEMRLVLAKIIWTFDLELGADSKDWVQRCKVFRLWAKPPLNVQFTERAKRADSATA